MMVRGAIEADLSDDGRWYVRAGRLLSKPTNLRSLLASRALLESYARERLLRLHNVTLMSDCAVVGPLGSAARIRGVRLRIAGEHGNEESLPADLVVDASGHASATPHWLAQLGLRAPAEERIRADTTYTTRTYPRTPDQLDGQLLSVSLPQQPSRLCGMALAIEDSRWMITLGQPSTQRPPLEVDQFTRLARMNSATDLHELVRAARPLSPAECTDFEGSVRRRYDRLARFPEGLLVIGDALCSTNPIYAQGMSLGALQANWLDHCLRTGTHQLGQRFFAAVGPLLDAAWSVVEFGDLGTGAIIERAPALTSGIMRIYFERLQHAAVIDATAARACLRVLQLEAPPRSLLGASLAARALLLGDSRPAFMPRRLHDSFEAPG
jgi:2-polyprenyl-6-methoxyphenol hydroxylase-like FAD-dependent oxidoreductase